MNEEGVLDAVKTKLQTLTSVNDNSVFISTGPYKSAVAKLIFPIMQIKPGTFIPDDESPAYHKYNFVVILMTRVFNDSFGETPIMGTTNQSGIVDHTQEILDKLDQYSIDYATTIYFDGALTLEPINLDGQSYIAMREMSFSCHITESVCT